MCGWPEARRSGVCTKWFVMSAVVLALCRTLAWSLLVVARGVVLSAHVSKPDPGVAEPRAARLLRPIWSWTVLEASKSGWNRGVVPERDCVALWVWML